MNNSTFSYSDTTDQSALLNHFSRVTRCSNGFAALCPAHRDNNRSLSISWNDDGKLLLNCFAGCSFAEILAAAGLERREASGRSTTSTTSRFFFRPPQAGLSEPPQARNLEYAERIWRQCHVAMGTVVKAYLHSRGLTGPIPPTIRFHPQLKHPAGPFVREAMVAAVQDVSGKFTGIHRTFLDHAKKTSLDPPKAALGPIAGGAVRLSQQIGDALVLCEGIEDGLSIAQTRGLIVWAVLGTSNLKAVKLPDCVSTVTIAADNDIPGQRAAEAAAKRFHEEGRMVRIAYPAGGAKDFNAFLLSRLRVTEAAVMRNN